MECIIYGQNEIETQTLEREILVHGAMHYKCENCGEMYRIWLEKGLEDRLQDEEYPELHKPVPYIILCACGGRAKHILWETDIHLNEYRKLKDTENYFENVQGEECGKLKFKEERINE